MTNAIWGRVRHGMACIFTGEVFMTTGDLEQRLREALDRVQRDVDQTWTSGDLDATAVLCSVAYFVETLRDALKDSSKSGDEEYE